MSGHLTAAEVPALCEEAAAAPERGAAHLRGAPGHMEAGRAAPAAPEGGVRTARGILDRPVRARDAHSAR